SSLTANGPLWDYSSAGLPRNAWLFNASNPGSVLDLSSMQDMNAGFNDVNGNVRAHTVRVGEGAVIDLSGLVSVTAPARAEDLLVFSLNDATSTIDLSSLSTIGGGGQTVFDLFRGSSLLLPSLSNVNNARFRVRSASVLTANGSLWDYRSAGLPGRFTLFLATDPGSVLDLSSLQNLDDGFNDANGSVSLHTVTASGGGTIDLSGLVSVIAPARAEDRLVFDLADATSTITLTRLASIDGGGQTVFSLIGGSHQSLPSLSSVNNGRFFVSGASTLAANGPLWDYSSASLPGDFTLFSATNPGSVLDLSSLQNLDTGFNDNDGNASAHVLVAADGARIDLSGLVSVTAPARAEDVLELFVADNGAMDVSRLRSITGSGEVAFVISRGGELRIGDLAAAAATTNIRLNDPDTTLDAAGSLLLERAGTTSPVSLWTTPDATVKIGKDFAFDHTDEAQLYLESGVIHFTGTSPQFVEVGGVDLSTATPTSLNFGFGQMIVGSDTQATTVYLRDAIDNGNGHVLCGPGEEALYLLGLQAEPANPAKNINGLRILGGSTLVLNGIPMYTEQDGALVDVRTWFPPGQSVISYDLNNSNGFIALGSSPETDADADGVFDKDDNCVVVANGPNVPFPWLNPVIDPNQRDTNGDGYGNICDPDLDGNGIVQAADLANLKRRFFTRDPDADLDGNGFVQAGDLAIMKRRFFQPPGPSCVAP
ncbi:MAG: hypothetical protein KJO91_06740, partial [Gammaproteobacteria bacterium]|nr:hypothetical protein [Gammaproteobacteria bacterium]